MPVTKLSELSYHNVVYLESYERIHGINIRRPTLVYNLREIQQIREEELAQRLYGDEDFVIPPTANGRNTVKAKIGKLFIEYCPGGKDSFELSIKVVDRNSRTLRSFLNLQNPRYSEIKFENLLPFSLDAFYSSRTLVRGHYGMNRKENLSNAHELKRIITKLLMNQSLTEQHRNNFLEHYQALYRHEPQQAQAQSHHESRRDISHFGRNLGDKPTSLFEVATKIGAIALINLSISEEEISDVLVEYLQQTRQTADVFNEEKTKKAILETLIDNNRYPLRACVADIDELLNKAIQQLSTLENAPFGLIDQNEEGVASEPTTAKELDELIQSQLTRPQGIKELKNQYLEFLSQQIPSLSADLRLEMALYLLNEPEHFLKKERHFFRVSTYSIQTLSMHSVISSLLQGNDRPPLLNDQVTVEEDHVLSRHAAQFF